jgi:hypothetical protein
VIQNSKGKIFYGMHFYPGVAEYAEPGKDPYRVFLNEDTIRSMDPTFAGRPIFVEHVSEVDEDIDQLRKDADGWVIESFYNSADGKHWVKFIVVSEHGERAIKSGMRLSNAYIPKSFGQGGLWNGVAYAREITGGEFEHLAIVRNPRYEESVIMTPDEFKLYNENKLVELKRLSNSRDEKGDKTMAFKLFKRTKVENAIDVEGMSVVLPKSGKEVTISQLVNEMDEHEEKKKNGQQADPSHMVKLHDGSTCNVGELLAKHKAMHDELEALKGKKEDEIESEEDVETESEDVEVEGDKSNDEDEAAKKKALELAEHEEKEIDAAKKKNALEITKKKVEAKKKADALRNAHLRDAAGEVVTVEFSGDQVERGKSRYGSN